MIAPRVNRISHSPNDYPRAKRLQNQAYTKIAKGQLETDPVGLFAVQYGSIMKF